MSSLPFLTFTLFGISSLLIYLFLVWNFNYWKRRGIKSHKPIPLFGSFPNMITHKRNVVYDLQDVYKQYRKNEDFIGVFSVRTPQILVLSSDLAHKVFVTNFKNFRYNEISTWADFENDVTFLKNAAFLRDDNWKESRIEATSTLTPNKIKNGFPAMKQCCKLLTEYMKRNCTKPSKEGIDIKFLCLRFTSEIVTEFALGIRANSFQDDGIPLPEITKKLFERTKLFAYYVSFAGLMPIIKSFYKAKLLQPETEHFFFELINSALKMRHNEDTQESMDFLGHVLQMRNKKNLSNKELISHVITLVLDGIETASLVISGCLYQLSKHPVEQNLLRIEIMENLNEKGEIDFEKLESMNYLDQCIHESMRLIPPLLVSTKLCTEHCELTNKNGKQHKIKPGDILVVPNYCLHHDEQYYPEPEKFIPERFSPENGGHKKFRDMGVFFPFGDGPRICLGMKFALTEIKIAVAEIIRNFNVELNPRTRKDNCLKPANFVGSLNGGIWLDFEEIKHL